MMALPQELQFDKYAQQILENSKSVVASTPTITTLSGSEFLNKLSASIFNSIQLQQLQTAANEDPTVASAIKMDFDMAPNHVSIDSSSFAAMDELQKQLDYDKFMNEVWIGIVLTLVLISMVFCICSCFLYHQFRTWKRNYHTNLTNAQALDVESMKLNPDHMEDPVPEYTLVSGLPSYEAALELLHKTPNSCVIVYPSVFSVFNKHEKASNTLQQLTPTLEAATTPLMATETLVKSVSQNNNNNNDDSIPSYTQAIATTTTTTVHINEKTAKVPSYDEALLVKTDKC